MSLARLDPQRYYECIDSDTERLLAMGALGLDQPVPCCQGWTVADVASHVAHVYEHKVRVMADNAWPDPWPPTDEVQQPPLVALTDAKAHLFAEFADHELADETTTFSVDDSTIAFWVRRMSREVAVHRYDAELAHDRVTPVPDDIALDGVDEVLRVMLAGPWWSDRVVTEHPIEALVAVACGGQRWVCDVRAGRITVSDAAGTAAATISGEPMPLFLWLWGRVGDDQVRFDGDPALPAEFRARLAECTG